MEPFCVRRIRAKNIQQPQPQWEIHFSILGFGFISSHSQMASFLVKDMAGNMRRIRSLANFQHCWGVFDRNVDGFTGPWFTTQVLMATMVHFLALQGLNPIWTQLPARCIQFNRLTVAVQQSNHPQCRFHDQGDPEEWQKTHSRISSLFPLLEIETIYTMAVLEPVSVQW